jgi:hypothetical protein
MATSKGREKGVVPPPPSTPGTPNTPDLRKSVSGLLSEITHTPIKKSAQMTPTSDSHKKVLNVVTNRDSPFSTPKTPNSMRKQMSRGDSRELSPAASPRGKFTLPRENSSKALLIAQGGGSVQLRKQISRSNSSVGDNGSGASKILNSFVDEVLVSSPTAALARQKSTVSTDKVK